LTAEIAVVVVGIVGRIRHIVVADPAVGRILAAVRIRHSLDTGRMTAGSPRTAVADLAAVRRIVDIHHIVVRIRRHTAGIHRVEMIEHQV